MIWSLKALKEASNSKFQICHESKWLYEALATCALCPFKCKKSRSICLLCQGLLVILTCLCPCSLHTGCPKVCINERGGRKVSGWGGAYHNTMMQRDEMTGLNMS